MTNTISIAKQKFLSLIKTDSSQDKIFSEIATSIRESYGEKINEKESQQLAKNLVDFCQKIIDIKTRKENKEKNYLVDRKTAAEFLGVRENTLAVWATNNRYNLPYIKVGRLVKYRIHDLEAFLEQNLK